MLPQMTLLFPKDVENAKALKVLAVAALVDIPLHIEYIENSASTRSQDPDFLNYCDPCGEYPVLRLDEEPGITIFGANAIMRYVARLDEHEVHHVYGRTPFEASQVDAWIDFSSVEIDAANAPYMTAVFPSLANNFKRVDVGRVSVPDAAVEGVERVLAGLEEALSIRTFLVGERLSIADVAVAFSVQLVYRCNKKYGDTLAKKYRAVYRHYNTVMRHPKVKEVLRREGATIGPLRT